MTCFEVVPLAWEQIWSFYPGQPSVCTHSLRLFASCQGMILFALCSFCRNSCAVHLKSLALNIQITKLKRLFWLQTSSSQWQKPLDLMYLVRFPFSPLALRLSLHPCIFPCATPLYTYTPRREGSCKLHLSLWAPSTHIHHVEKGHASSIATSLALSARKSPPSDEKGYASAIPQLKCMTIAELKGNRGFQRLKTEK